VVPAKAVVLAQPPPAPTGGSTARLGRSSLPPTPLLPLANRPLLDHALRWLAQAGVRQAAMIVPQALADPVRQTAADAALSLSLSWMEQAPDKALAQTLGDLAGFLDGEAFVLHLADSVARQSLRSLMADRANSEADALLVLDESRGVELAQVVQLRAAAGGARALPRALSNDMAGVAVISARVLEAVADLDIDPERVLETLAEGIRQRGGRVGTCCATKWWRFRGGADALLDGNRFALEGQRPDYDRAQLVDSNIQGAVVAHPEARIECSVVRGPAIIGARARLRDAYVGPYTSIGEDVVIEGAEIEHSVVLQGASISHLGGRLEASVIGPKSRIFRDFRLPRALRLTVGEGAEVSLT
jgi:glucose-1-phosphate thymidylyltransferase